MSTRETAVAGQFYHASAEEIEGMLDHYNKILDEHIKDATILELKPRAVIVPHAGYVYSGFTANIALRLLGNSDVKRIVVIGPSHRVFLSGTSVSDFDNYRTPLGTFPVDRELVEELKRRFGLHFQPDAHQEHSTEVEMPLIKEYQSDVSVVELVYGQEQPADLAEVI
ncbi:MAG TPA: AmmeMemoRadiSam system protein B, partial [Epsilonproteobacteria bacterium]|nr:AmmeMemoRadiSam system protein B [Campylobacterota bacterium]